MATTPKKQLAVRGDEAAAIASERLRIAAIIDSPEGKRNPGMANKLALYSSLDAETARTILAEAPPANPYIAAMEQEGPVGLNAPVADLGGDPKSARLAEIEKGMSAFNNDRRRSQGMPEKKKKD